MKFAALAQPGKIGKLELKNRIIFPPVNNNYTRGGFMTDESIEFYVARARGGCSLVIIEATSVDYPRSRSVLNPALSDDKYMPQFAKIADGIHQYGAKVFVQLSHVGRQTTRATTGMEPIAPSAIASHSPQYTDIPRALELPEIKELVEMFGRAAVRAQKSGMDGVELILGHGYLMNAFLLPAGNKRTDEYGGFKGGVKFCTDIVRKIKENCGEDYPIVARLNADDFIMQGGNTPVEYSSLVQQLEKAGVDCLSVSGGMRDSELNYADHSSGSPRGAWIHLADRLKRVVNIPVMAVKRLTPDIAETIVREGKTDFVCFGKPLIADAHYAEKILEDRLEDVIYCTSCCQGCYDQLWQKIPITCLLNPPEGRKMEYLKKRAESMGKGDKKVLIVGAGPAGCEAALEAAKKGHKVTLIEKEPELGGFYRTCKYLKNKFEVERVFDPYFATALDKQGVDVRLNTPFSPALLDELKPQVVIDATGADFKMPPIEGVDLPHVLNPIEAIDDSKPVGDYVAVVSCSHYCTWTCGIKSNEIPDDVVGLKTLECYPCAAGQAAADVAEELAQRGKKVFVLTGRDAFVPGMGFTNRKNMLVRYFKENCTISNNVKVKKIVPGEVICEKDGFEFKVAADTVVMSVAMQSRNYIEEQLKGRDVEFYRVGDCAKIGNALTAIHTAYELVDKF